MKKMGYIFIALGAVLVIVGCWLVFSQKSEPEQMQEIAKSDTVVVERIITERVIEKETPVTQVVQSVDDSQIEKEKELDENEDKGLEFEKFVVKHFGKKYIKLKEWRSDKFIDGRYAESNRYPDMELELILEKGVFPFAVECKWRSHFVNGSIEWAKPEQIQIYNDFAKERKMPVFVVIGIAGKPSKPNAVYSVPLKDMQKPNVTEEELAKYKKEDVDKYFFYDLKTQQLK